MKVSELIAGDIAETLILRPFVAVRFLVLRDATDADMVLPEPGDKWCLFMPDMTSGFLFFDDDVTLIVRAK